MQYFLILFLFTLSSFGFDYQLKPYALTKNIDCFFGLHGKAKESNGGRVINTCYIKSNNGYIVIDSGPTYSYAQQAYSVMQKKEKLPVKYVINTSSQELHILGNEFYKEQGATLIGPKSYETLIQNQKPLSLFEKLSNAIFVNTRLIPLDVYQNEDTVINIGKTKIEIKKLEKGDSKNLVVYLPSEETIFVGNFIANKQIPQLKEHTSLNDWIENLKTIESMAWKHIISAHGVKRNRQALRSTQQYLNNIKTTVLNSIKNPKEKSDTKLFTAYKNLAFFKDFHTNNIQEAYDELKLKATAHPSFNVKDEIVLAAMSNIKTEETLKNGTTKAIIIQEESTPSIIKEKEIKISRAEKIKKPQKIEKVKVAKVEILKELSVKNIIQEAAQTEIAPITEESVPSINYDKDFYTAQQHALKEHKMVLIKVEADNCHPCEELDEMLASNKNIRKMINKYTKAIKINTSYESVPLGLSNMGTPTVFVINPKTEGVLMQLEGALALEDLEDSLRALTSENVSALAFAK